MGLAVTQELDAYDGSEINHLRLYHHLGSAGRERRHRKMRSVDRTTATKAVAERALAAGLDVSQEVRWGDPSAASLAYPIENEVDLIVMGTHGRTGYERYLLGSVAEKVVRIAPIPVLVVAVGDVDDVIADIRAGLRRQPVGGRADEAGTAEAENERQEPTGP